MSDFDPDKAVMEPDEGDEMDCLFADMEKKMRSMRSQLFADVVKEIARSAKQERQKLLESAGKNFAESMRSAIQPELDKLSQSIMESVAKKQDAMAERLASIDTRTKDQHLSVVSRLKNLSSMHEEMANANSPVAPSAAVDLSPLQAKLDALCEKMEAPAPMPVTAKETPKPKQWRFTVQRDLHNRITDIYAAEDLSNG